MRKAEHAIASTLLLLTATLAGGILVGILLDAKLEENTRTTPRVTILVLEEALPGKLCVRNIGTSEAQVDAIHLKDPHEKTLWATHVYPTPYTIPPGETRCLPLPEEFKNHARKGELVAYRLGTSRTGSPLFIAPFLPPPGEVLLAPIIFAGGSEAYYYTSISYGSAATPESGTLLLVNDPLTSTLNYTLLTQTSTGPLALTWEGGFTNAPPVPSLSCNQGGLTLMYGIGDNGTGAFHPWYTIVENGVPQTLSGNQLSLTTFWYNASGDNTVTYTTGDIILQGTQPTASQPSWLLACGVDAVTGRFYILGVERNAALLNTTSNTPASVSNPNFIAYQNPNSPGDSAYMLFWWADDKGRVPSFNTTLLSGPPYSHDLLIKGDRVYISGPINSPLGTYGGVLSLEASLTSLLNATLYTGSTYGSVASNTLFLEDAGANGLLVLGFIGTNMVFSETLDPQTLDPQTALVAEIPACSAPSSCMLQDATVTPSGDAVFLILHSQSWTEYSLLLLLLNLQGSTAGPVVNLTVTVNGTRVILEDGQPRAYRIQPSQDGAIVIWGPLYNNSANAEFLGFLYATLPLDTLVSGNLPQTIQVSTGPTIVELFLDPLPATINTTVANALLTIYHQPWVDVESNLLGGPGGTVRTTLPKPPQTSQVTVLVSNVSNWFNN